RALRCSGFLPMLVFDNPW
ncbi:hypothetical protein D039_3060B, partial [Vibrio parahaemolyticus EKP-028]